MKGIAIISLALLLNFGCSGPADDDNKGAQSDQDYPSNRDRDVSSESQNSTPSAQEMQDNDSLHQDGRGQAGQGEPPNQAPNNGQANPQENMHGQSGTNQTGK
jgi:hypothetical protein